jgi:DNA (cytosine-5)-methyltransferase 1
VRLLDLFCCEGGAAKGYQRAGFHVTGVDLIDKSDVYAGDEFVQGDALEFLFRHGHEFDAVHASPPCQGYTIATAGNPEARGKHAQLIRETRWMLGFLTGIPWVIENVQQARSQMADPILLCGRMFGLETTDEDGEPLVLDRHRLFESNVPLVAPEHPKHDGRQVAGVYTGGRARKPGATAAEHRHDCRTNRRGGYVPASREVRQRLLGIDWMTDKGMAESIPPVYAERVGRQLAAHIGRAAA